MNDTSFQQLLEECTIGTKFLEASVKSPLRFQQLLEECTIGTLDRCDTEITKREFQQLLEECTIGTRMPFAVTGRASVSVVVRRMYYWDKETPSEIKALTSFSSCQKNVLLGQNPDLTLTLCLVRFSSCQKNVLLGLVIGAYFFGLSQFQQLLEECTIGTSSGYPTNGDPSKFQQLLEECTIGTRISQAIH